jgi:hypothetical protein
MLFILLRSTGRTFPSLVQFARTVYNLSIDNLFREKDHKFFKEGKGNFLCVMKFHEQTPVASDNIISLIEEDRKTNILFVSFGRKGP